MLFLKRNKIPPTDARCTLLNRLRNQIYQFGNKFLRIDTCEFIGIKWPELNKPFLKMIVISRYCVVSFDFVLSIAIKLICFGVLPQAWLCFLLRCRWQSACFIFTLSVCMLCAALWFPNSFFLIHTTFFVDRYKHNIHLKYEKRVWVSSKCKLNGRFGYEM